jgi:hypothetical protein
VIFLLLYKMSCLGALMAITFNPYAAAVYVAAIPLGFVFVAGCLALIRWTIGIKSPWFKWLDFWLGTTERAVVWALYAWWEPDRLSWFIGAWVGLKFAANWKRQTGRDAKQGSLVFLIGNVLSFSFALATVWLARKLS